MQESVGYEYPKGKSSTAQGGPREVGLPNWGFHTSYLAADSLVSEQVPSSEGYIGSNPKGKTPTRSTSSYPKGLRPMDSHACTAT
jgi:hypothetical protein